MKEAAGLMADEDNIMANGFDAQARYAALDERVTNLRASLVNLEGEMRSGFSGLNNHLTSLSNELRSSQKTQWPVIWAAAGVCFTVLMGIGGTLYWPVISNLSEQKQELKTIRETTVPREELDWRGTRGQEDRLRSEKTLTDLRADLVPRREHERVWAAYDQRLADQQRQIDDIKTAQGATYSTRDIILDLRERLDRVERTYQPRMRMRE